LPISIKNVTNKEAFKNAVKEYFKFEARREENEYFSTISNSLRSAQFF
jgi:hypothetical protein